MKDLLLVIIAFVFVICFVALADAETESEEEIDYDPYLVLVNKDHRLPDGWENVVEIITVENSLNEEIQIEKKTYEAFSLLRNELMKNYGIQIELDSVYRSVEEQQEIWDEWSVDPDKGEDYCKKYLATPGYSEHHTGLAVDIFIMKNGKEIRENDDMIADVEDFATIHELLPIFGFILRYPEGMEDITGYAYEPWHFRYVNNPITSIAISEAGITFEKFLGKVK